MKVLIVGLGSIAKKHIDAINQLVDNCEILALRSSEKAPSIDGVYNLFTIEECKTREFDFIIISNPTSEHFDSIKTLSDFNVPLFIEKPIFSNINEETEALVKDIVDAKIDTYIACNLRFLEALCFLKDTIKDARINEVNVYCGSYLPDWRPNVDFRTVYSANVEMGGGVHIDLIHELDYVYWLFGEPSSTISNFSNNSSLAISANDYANYFWRYDNFNVSVVLNYYRRKAKREIEVVTVHNVYRVDLLLNIVYKDDKVIFAHKNRIPDTYLSQMRFFIDHVLLSKGTMNDINEANQILKLCMQE